MRVIAGERKGHHLKAVPGTNTRPTTDKIKESLFSIIGPFFDGEKVLDLFAGSGGLGIEALSRGASECVFIDQAQAAIKTVHLNVSACHLEAQAHIFRNESKRALKLLAKNAWAFDLVFLDPPYKKQQLEQLMTSLAELELVNDEALAICEHDADAKLPDEIAGFKKNSGRALRDYGAFNFRV
ncbi:RsmD family RNA methyltransferase [Listeria weihenstephanensis FSL R9-0317]|nr:RsmD family RNA methyltransferase [Listeria weihenstephanensis FSL R9-0317]